MNKEVQLSASEEQALIALAAKSPLRGDKRTDAKAGTIHAPTAKRLCEKGLAGRKEAFGSYVLLPAGKVRLPGAAALQPTEPRDCRKYLGKSAVGGGPVLCNKPKGHEDDCGNPEPYKPRKVGELRETYAAGLAALETKVKGKLPPNAPKAEVEAMNAAAHEAIARQASSVVVLVGKVESRASLAATEPVGSLPESTRIWAQECADKAIGRNPKAKPVDAAPSNVDAPAVVREALKSPKAPPTPAVLLDALDPSAPAPVYQNVTPEINDLVAKLHTTGTLLLKSEKGEHYRINAQNHGAKGFEYWGNDPETGFWKRIRLGELPAVLSGVSFVSDQPVPGAQPFRAPSRVQSVET